MTQLKGGQDIVTKQKVYYSSDRIYPGMELELPE